MKISNYNYIYDNKKKKKNKNNMPLSVTFDLDVLCEDTNNHAILFYELVLKNEENKAILRLPFSKKSKPYQTIELFSNKETIPETKMKYSSHPRVLRYDKDKEYSFHLYKVLSFDDISHISYVSRITPETSVSQDMPLATCLLVTENIEKLGFVSKVISHTSSQKEFTPVDQITINGRLQWLTQRKFYGTSHITGDDSVHRDNIEIIAKKFLRGKGDHVHDVGVFLQQFARIITNGRIKYEHDTSFSNSAISNDTGNACIELSVTGDCEDLAHYYMRMIRTLTSIYHFIAPDNKFCKLLEEKYVPLNYICQVRTGAGLEYHSTMLVLPYKKGEEVAPVVSFEVTNTDLIYTLPSTDFQEWHVASYVLLDNFFLCKVKNYVQVEKLDIQSLNFTNF